MKKLGQFTVGIIACINPWLYADTLHTTSFIEPIMVDLPAGEFLMGSDLTPAEQPIHKVKIDGFMLAKYDVTVKEFSLFTKATNYQATGNCFFKSNKGVLQEVPKRWGTLTNLHGEYIPATCVSWDDTQAYIAWLNAQTSKQYRLPSEAEWEYAARAGSTQTFHFGNNEKQLCQYANGYDQTAALTVGRDSQWSDPALACDDQQNILSTVGIFKPNQFGLYDMLGNVSQWVADCYHANYQGAPLTGAPWTSQRCTTHFARGGSWSTNVSNLRSSFRPISISETNSDQGHFDRGFRLALDASNDAMLNEKQKPFLTDLAKAQKKRD